MAPPPQHERSDELTGRAAALVERVHRTLHTPGDRAALRRGLGQPPEHPNVRASHRIVATFVRDSDSLATERAFYAVASLIAAQPRKARDDSLTDTDEAAENEPAGTAAATELPAPRRPRHTNLGATLAQAVNSRILSEQTTEARLHLLCRQNLDGLHRHLPRLIAHLRADLVPIDWVQLTLDLARWPIEGDRVAKRWLQAFHRTITPDAAIGEPDKDNS
jgi:CRISPR type I-E-associated protein CasB/Cse2